MHAGFKKPTTFSGQVWMAGLSPMQNFRLLTGPWKKLAEPEFQLAVIGMTVHNVSDENTFHWYIPMFSYRYISIYQHMHFSPAQRCRALYNSMLFYIMLCWIIFRYVFLDLVVAYNMWNLPLPTVSPPKTTENIATLVQRIHGSATAFPC